MREVHIVQPYTDGPIEVFRDYALAFTRKGQLDRQYGNMAVLTTLPFQDDKLRSITTPLFGASGVHLLGGQAVRGSSAQRT